MYNVPLWRIGVIILNVETQHFLPGVYCCRADVSVDNVINIESVATEPQWRFLCIVALHGRCQLNETHLS